MKSAVIVEPQKTAEISLMSSETTDEQLLITYRDTGDEALFTALVSRYEREMFSYLRRYLGNAEMAEDAFQATFLQLHLKCDQFQEGRRLKPWLYMIATNKAIDLQRRNKRHRSVSLNGYGDDDETGRLIDMLVSEDPSPQTQANKAEEGDWISSRLNELPENLRMVVNLVYYQGLKYREAAEALSIPVGTVKSRLHSAILKLSDAWDTTHDEGE